MYNKRGVMTKSKTKVEDVNTYPIAAIKDRHISLETAKKYGVRIGVSESDGKTPTHHYYPYTRNGEVVGYKARLLSEKKFYAVGTVDYHCELFGQSVCRGGKKLFCTEGESDCMVLYEVLKKGAERSGYGSHEPNVVSVGGAGWAVDHLSNNKDFLDKFKEIILVFDQDSAGEEAVRNVSHLFPSVKYAEFSKKDPCDMVAAGKSDELFKAALYDSKQYRPSGIIQGSEITLEQLQKPKPKGISLPYPDLDKMLRGLRPGEITTVTSGSGCGKTTLISEIEYHLNKYHQEKVATIYLETGSEDSARKQIAIDNNVPVDELSENPNLIQASSYEKSYNDLIANGRWAAIDHWGSLESDELIYKIRHLATVEGCKYVILDHISLVVSGQDTNDERKAIDLLMSNLASLVVELQIHLINVVHLTRRQGKDYYTGSLPSLGDLRGSGGLEQLSWNVIALSRDQSAEDPDRVELWILKNRNARRIGKADTCSYNQQTGRLLPVTEEF